MKNKLLLLTSLLVLVFSSCKNIEQGTSNKATATVSFAADSARAIYAEHSNSDYTYTISGTSDSGTTFQTDKKYTYTELSSARFEIQKGSWDFTMNAYTGEEVIFSGTKSVTLTDEPVNISIPLHAVTGSTASLSFKLNYPVNKGVAKITAGLYDSVTDSDTGSALTLEAGYVTYTNDDVPSGINKILKFYLYDSQDVCIGSFIEGVFLAARDNISVERTLSNVNTFAASVWVKDTNGNDLTDSGLLVKAVQDDKKYPMTAVSGTNMYTASLPVGTYDVYAGLIDTDIDLVVKFLQGGNATIIFATKETLNSAIAGLTEDSTIRMAGELTNSDLTEISAAINNSTYKVNLDLSLTTGLTSIPDSPFINCTKLSGIIIPDSVTSIGDFAFWRCTSLTTITVDSNNANYSTIDGVLFNKDASTLIRYPAGKQSAAYTIPDSVTSIGDYAFCYCKALSSVTIPDSVTSIGEWAFYGCSSLSSVTIGNSVTTIAQRAFSGCSALSSVTIPDSVTSIGNGAFQDCTSLSSVTFNCHITFDIIGGFYDLHSDSVNIVKSVNIGESVTSIEGGCLGALTCFTDISVDSNNANYSSIDGVLFNKDVTAIIAYPAGKQSAAYTIPESVTSIRSYAFHGCTSLSSVTIPDSVTSIGVDAFYACTSLSSVTIPDSVTTIGNSAFMNCYSLSSVTIPDSVTSIGYYAFQNCKSLSSVTIPDSVTSIGIYAFCDCKSLTSVTIPDSVTTISQTAFLGCTSLESINVDSNNTIYCSIDGVLFNKDATAIITYPAGKQSAAYAIPDSVTSIGDNAFQGCTSLSSVTIPDSVTSIGNKAFYQCASLSSVTIPESVTSIGNEAFSYSTSLSSVTIGDSVTSIGDMAFIGCSKLTSITFIDTTTWYRTGNETNWKNKTNGTLTDVSDAAANATYFKNTYNYWYKLY